MDQARPELKQKSYPKFHDVPEKMSFPHFNSRLAYSLSSSVTIQGLH